MEEICSLISYVNGQLNSEADDLIDDSKLYFLFIRLASLHRQMNNDEGRDLVLRQVLDDYEEPIPGAKNRVEAVLKVMLTAWAAGLLRQQACQMAAELKTENTLRT